MVRHFVTPPHAIILAVTPANQDLATSDALNLARQVDPDGLRTVGVLTKLDLMDKGTDAGSILRGEEVRLQLGWVGVVNRGQADIHANVGMSQARSQETHFFRSHPVYASIPNHVGTHVLAKVLSSLLEKTLRREMPRIARSIQMGLHAADRELEHLGEPITDRSECLHEILRLATLFQSIYAQKLDGGRGGGERILAVFKGAGLVRVPFQELCTPDKVAQTVAEADGYQPYLIAPELGYRRLIEEGLRRLRRPALDIVDQVHAICEALVDATLADEQALPLSRFHILQAEMRGLALATLAKYREHAEQLVRTLVDMEASYLTADFFREIVTAMPLQQEPSTTLSTRGAGHLRGGEGEKRKSGVGGKAGKGGKALMKDLHQDGEDDSTEESDVASVTTKATAPIPTLGVLDAEGQPILTPPPSHLLPREAHLYRISRHVLAYLQVVTNQLRITIPKAVVHCLVDQAKKHLIDRLWASAATVDEHRLTAWMDEADGMVEYRVRLLRRREMLREAHREITTTLGGGI